MELLRDALLTIQMRVNEYLMNFSSRDDQWVALNSPFNMDGSVNEDAQDKILMMIYNIRKEDTHSAHVKPMPGSGGFAVAAPPLYINLDLAFIANFSARRYADGLAALSRVISYFQQTPVFNQANAPDLDPRVGKLTLDFVNLDTVDVNYIMSMLGMMYLPSVFYQLRMLPFDAAAIQGRAAAVRGPRIIDPAGPRGDL
jgi:hypothetical protein